MADFEAVRAGANIIATVIGEMMEDATELALTAQRRDPAVVAHSLRAFGADIVTLAEAMAVLARQANP